MINVKDQIYSALTSITGMSDSVSDIYPTTWEKMPCIQYVEESNTVYTKTDNEEQLSYLSYRIDVWGTGNISSLVMDVDEKMSALGLTRIVCMDVDDPTHYRHKQMRYEGIIDNETEMVYWNSNR